MQASYTHQVLRLVVAKICQTIGWQSVSATSLEIMIDILDRYIREICKTTHDYAEHYNRTEANLDDLELTFRDMGINMSEIIEYISYVDPIVTNIEVPKYPIPKESHLNFLKPGSKEVLTRPVHIHEHLPPINPQEEEQAYTNGEKEIDVVGLPSESVFKHPADAIDGNAAKKIKLEEEGRATREITSVMMTTSGFISPAREGKLPESKPPKLPDEFPKPVPPPKISPPTFKVKDEMRAPGTGLIDKKLEKKLKKKNHDKEKKKEKQHKDKYPLPEPNDLAQFDPIPQQPTLVAPPTIMPREANEHMLMAERKKELKKLKMKNKEETKKPKKEKIPKHPKMQSFENAFADNKPINDPYQVLPTSIPQPPQTSSQIQAHKYLTGAAHGLFPTNLFDQSTFGTQQPLMSTQNPLIEGKLVSEPDKQKLNIFKKISKPKEDPIKHQPVLPPQTDFLTPSKLDRFDTNQPSTSQAFADFVNTGGKTADPIKKMHKLPKETTLTRVNDDSLNLPMNLSGLSRSNESSFEDMSNIPKTPTMPPKTPDFKMSQSVEKKEKKERKKKEKKIDQPDWLQQQQQQFSNPFDLSSPQNNAFLQNLQNTGGIMGNLANSFMMNRNPFALPATDIFSSGPGLIPRTAFNMSQSSLNSMINSYGMDMNNLFQQQQQQPVQPQATVKPKKQQSSNMNTAFDQLLKDQQHQQQQNLSTPGKKFVDEKVETFDLTKDSSPEPIMTAPMPSTSIAPIRQEIAPAPATPSLIQDTSLPIIPEHSELQLQPQPIVKEKSKEKKKKKDKDRDKERDKDKEERKKKKKEKKKKKDKHKEKHRASMSTLDSQSNDTEDTADNNSTSSVPKLMLRLNSPRPNTPDTAIPKKTIIQRSRNEDFEFPSPGQEMSHRDEPHSSGYTRDPSPELARISPLVTRPPKIKQSTSIYPSSGDYSMQYHQPQSNYVNQNTYDYNNQYMDYQQQQNMSYVNPQMQYQQLHHYQPQQQINTGHYQYPAATHYPQQTYQNQPQLQQDYGYINNNNNNNNQTWNISQNKASYIDADGSTVWICPACGSIDDGSPMIGCDSCDAWYHWACVGIKVEPNENEDWFCRACISRKQSGQLEGKKKKRKKKDKESKNL